MIKHRKEILEYLKDYLDLNLEENYNVAIINIDDISIIELLYDSVYNIYFVTNNNEFDDILKKDYPKIIIVRGSEENTSLNEKTIDYILLNSNVNNFNIKKTRTEFKKILKNHYSDIIIFENTTKKRRIGK